MGDLSGGLPGPDFLCIGAQKAGTQWLYDQLSFHPRVWMPPIKEIHFFDADVRLEKILGQLDQLELGFDRRNRARRRNFRAPLGARDRTFLRRAATYRPGTSDIEWYADLFSGKGDLLSGDITPEYCALASDAVMPIVRRFPELKVIFLVREPIERAWSAIAMIWRLKHGVRDSNSLQWSMVSDLVSRPGFQRMSRPTRTVEIWSEHFSEERFHLALFDHVRSQPETVLTGVYGFLGLADGHQSPIAPDFNRKSAQKQGEMPEDIRNGLVSVLGDEVQRAAEMFGGPAAMWPARYGLD
jgi:Sulfotransferase family